MQLGSMGERCKLPSEVWGGAPTEIEFGAFIFTIWHLVAAFFLQIFQRVVISACN